MNRKSEKKQKKYAQKFSNSYFGTGPAECADAAEALESVSSRFRSGTLRPPRGGAGLFNRSAHSARPKQGLVGDHGEAIEGKWRRIRCTVDAASKTGPKMTLK